MDVLPRETLEHGVGPGKAYGPTPEKAPKLPGPAPRMSTAPSSALADGETCRRAIAAIVAVAGGRLPEKPSLSAAGDAHKDSPMDRKQCADFEALFSVDNAARARGGLPPRYPNPRAA